MKQVLLGILRQLFGMSKSREGKIVLTRRAYQEIFANGLYLELIQDTFRYGMEIKKEVIVKKYPKYTVGLYYKYDGVEDIYRITFVFKN